MATELAECQRYYHRETAANNGFLSACGYACDGTFGIVHVDFPVTMRIAPTALEQSGDASHYKVRRDTTQTCTAVPSFVDAFTFYARVNFPRSSHGWGTGQMLWCPGGSSSSYLGFSAEL